jgi:predicted ester cyclase
MSTEKNKASVRRFTEEVANKGNLSIIPEFFAPSYVAHATPEFKGPEGLKQYITMMRTAFPDIHQTIEHIIAEGDMVAVYYTMRGTFKGEMMGMAPTGKKLTLPNAVLSRFKDAKQVEAWMYYDSLAMFQQMGVSMPPG